MVHLSLCLVCAWDVHDQDALSSFRCLSGRSLRHRRQPTEWCWPPSALVDEHNRSSVWACEACVQSLCVPRPRRVAGRVETDLPLRALHFQT